TDRLRRARLRVRVRCLRDGVQGETAANLQVTRVGYDEAHHDLVGPHGRPPGEQLVATDNAAVPPVRRANQGDVGLGGGIADKGGGGGHLGQGGELLLRDRRERRVGRPRHE